MQLSTSSGVRNKSGPSATLGLGLDLAAAGIGYAFPRTVYVVRLPEVAVGGIAAIAQRGVVDDHHGGTA